MNARLLPTKFSVVFILTFLVITLPVYTQEDTQKSKNTPPAADTLSENIKSDILTPEFKAAYKEVSFPTWMNINAYAGTVDEKEEKAHLRKEWSETLGMDIFLPYFKAEEVESWIKEKARLNFFKMKGEPQLKRDQIQYIFQVDF